MNYPPHFLFCTCAECIRYGVQPPRPWPRDAKAPEPKLPMCNCPMPNPIVHVIGCPSRVDPKDALIKDLGAKLAAQRNELAMLNALNVSQGRTISQRHAAVDHLNRKIDKLQGDLAVANKTIDGLQDEVASRKYNSNTDSKVLESRNATIKDMNKQLAELRADLDRRVKELNETMDHKNSQLRESAAMYTEASKASLSRLSVISELQEETRRVRADRAEVVKSASESIAEFQSIIKSLREQLAAKPQPKTESELIADDLRHLAHQGGPAWSCLLSLADRAELLK